MEDLNRRVAATLMISFDAPELPEWVRRRLAEGIGGICLYGQNVTDEPALRALTTAIHEAAPDALVALDEEGGDVTRLHFRTGSPHAGHAVLGVVDDVALTEAVAGDIGAALLAAGVDLDLAPVADVNSNPLNPVIGVRSFGAHPELAARHVSAWVRGVQRAGVGACLKHFPGHGDTVADSHVTLPVVGAEVALLRRRELVPFRAGLAAGAVAVMTSHIVVRALDPSSPATFSPAATMLLRGPEAEGGLGFDGLLVSDALDMQGASGEIGVPAAAVKALAAGVDLLCLGPDFTDDMVQAVVETVAAAATSGELPESRVRRAAERVAAASGRTAALRAAAPRRGVLSGEPSSAVAALRGIVVDGAFDPLAGAEVVRLLAGANVAAGRAPWGLPVNGLVMAGRQAIELAEGDPLPDLDLDRPVVALVRGAHRYAWVTAALDGLARRRPDLVVVELGWPGPNRLPGAATVRTHGASAISAQALDRVLARGRR